MERVVHEVFECVGFKDKDRTAQSVICDIPATICSLVRGDLFIDSGIDYWQSPGRGRQVAPDGASTVVRSLSINRLRLWRSARAPCAVVGFTGAVIVCRAPL